MGAGRAPCPVYAARRISEQFTANSTLLKNTFLCLLASCAFLASGPNITRAEVNRPLDKSLPLSPADENFYLPGRPMGPATAETQSAAGSHRYLTLSSALMSATFRQTQTSVSLVSLRDLETGETLRWNDPNLFTIRLKGASVTSSSMRWAEPPRVIDLNPEEHQVNLARRFPGKAITADFSDERAGIQVHWAAILRDDSNYIRQEIAVTSSKAVEVEDIEMVNASLPGAELLGYTDGSPIRCGNWFLGLEHPMAKNVAPGAQGDIKANVTASLPRQFTLTPGARWVLSTHFGVAPTGQFRRAFAYYLQRERAHPYRQYWHYNSWYDLNIGRNDSDDPLQRMNEAQCLEVIGAFDRNLYQKYKVGLDGFVWDDGWDDWNSLWQFHKGFPRGFTKLKEAAGAQGAKVGAWLSPWGGYGRSHDMRVAFGRKQGYETNSGGLSLGGPKYRAVFLETCLKMIRDYQQDYFKFDGIGGGAYATGASPAISADLDGLVEVTQELRRANPHVFINCTVGTWASPYWTRFADSIWRQGDDTDFSGKGNARERWLNYKDKTVYARFSSKSVLFPVNSLMYHGLVLGATANPGKMPTPAQDLDSYRHEVQMMTGYASGLGELYLTPGLMTDEAWAILAECIQWTRLNCRILADNHWIGGDPGKDEIYGFAAWRPRLGGIITLRNPDGQRQAIALDLTKTWELPVKAGGTVLLRSPWKRDASKKPITAAFNQPLTLTLEPFEVITLQCGGIWIE